ncbi:MAG: oxidoreductase [Proteobacteria bacterium]|nr:oxidoreductase [Pseudomonadota bacterium]
MNTQKPLTIEIVSDVVCPWCFVGLRRLERAISLVREEQPDFLYVVRWRPFFLNPDTPPEGEPYLPFLVQKFGGRERVEEIWRRIQEVGASLGIDYQFERIQVRANTLMAHRLIHWAQQQGDASGVVEGLFKAQFERGENVSDRMVLANVAVARGYDQAEVLRYLDSDEDVSLIQQMEHESRTWGVSSVPTFVFDRKSGIQGAEDPRVLADGIKQAIASSGN